MNDIQRLRSYLEVELESHEVALEGFLGNIIPRIGDSLRRAYQSIAGYDNKKRISSNKNRFLKIVNELDYTSIMTNEVEVPLGFVGDNVQASQLLLEMIKHAQSTKKVVIDEVVNFLAGIVNEPVKRNDARSVLKIIFDRKKERETMLKTMKGFYNGEDASRIPLSYVIKRNADWKPYIDNLEDALPFFSIDKEGIQKGIERVVEMTNHLLEMIEHGTVSNTNKDILKSLADGIFAVAEEVTFIAQIFYWLSSHIEATDKNIDEFIRKYG